MPKTKRALHASAYFIGLGFIVLIAGLSTWIEMVAAMSEQFTWIASSCMVVGVVLVVIGAAIYYFSPEVPAESR